MFLLVNKFYCILLLIMIICVGCEWQLKPSSDSENVSITVDRYDRIETLYLTTGDYSALQQMNTIYPMQTRMLFEDILHIGKVDSPDISVRFHTFFQDSTLQVLLRDVQKQYGEMSDIESELSAAFTRLKEDLPSIEIPQIYAQVGSFDQSIVVGSGIVGISLDKYLGADYPFYQNHYSESERKMMVRSMIVPDCLGFYLLSIYPMPSRETSNIMQRSAYMGRIQWVVNKAVGRKVFDSSFVIGAGKLMSGNKQMTVQQLLTTAPL